MGPTDRWEDLYRSTNSESLPWYTPDLDPDFSKALSRRRLSRTQILDVGTGPATQSIALAKRGFKVIATDISPSAIRRAQQSAKKAAVDVDFRVDDIMQSKLGPALVDVVVDRGVFHVLPPESRGVYVDAVRRVLRPRGWLFLKCFSDKEPGTWGPYRIAAKELRSFFDERFEVVSIEKTTFQGTLAQNPRALFAVFRNRGRTDIP